jgi:hypothetical protein
MRSLDRSNVWIRTSSGELVRADAVVGLRNRDGAAEAVCSDGRSVRLAEPGCPPDFHARLLAHLARMQADDRWIWVISPQVADGTARWVHVRADESPGQVAVRA